MIKLAVSGVCGRMGRAVVNAVARSCDFEISAGIDSKPTDDFPFPVFKNFCDNIPPFDVIIDFSSPSCLDSILGFATATKTRCVLATTGYSATQQAHVVDVSKDVAIFQSANMSYCASLLVRLAKETAKYLGDDFDCEIIETHHRNKVDAPSGTAFLLANAVNDAKNSILSPVFGRKDNNKRRNKNEIGIHSVRGGNAVGTHEVIFLGDGERITISHHAECKDIFVKGALIATEFIMTKQNGLYSMNDLFAF